MLQFSMPLKPVPEITMLNNLREVAAFPFVWVDEGGDIDEENKKFFKDKLITPILLVDIAKWVLIALGILLMAAGGFMLCRA